MFLLLCKMRLSILIVRVVIASLNAIAILLGCYLSGTQQQNIYMIIYCGFFSFGFFFLERMKKTHWVNFVYCMHCLVQYNHVGSH